MKVSSQIVRLYARTARRYRKLFARINRSSTTPYQKKTFLQEIKKLLRKLRELDAQLRIAAATGTVVLLLNSAPVQAQGPGLSALGPFVKQDRVSNPLREPLFTGKQPIITTVDFDKDGDVDVVLGQYDYLNGATLRYFENQSKQGHPVYQELTGEDNPLDGIHADTEYAAPAFADLDGDGDLDLILGQNGWNSYYTYSMQGIEYFRNDDGVFNEQTGPWDETEKTGNPFDGVTLGEFIRPALVDFDKDGDVDVIFGSYQRTGSYPYYYYQYIHYYENNGAGTFTPAPLNIPATQYSYNFRNLSPAVADIDDDGDYDIVLGTYSYGNLVYFRQDTPGTFVKETGDWDPVAKTGNPFSKHEIGTNSSPAVADFNGDGLLDVFVADDDYGYKYSDHIINYYENTGNAVFVEKDEFENPFDGVFVFDNAAPALMDLDGDSDLDVVIGNKYDRSFYDYQNQTWVYVRSYLTSYTKEEDGKFYRVKPANDPFAGLQVFGNFAPQFADLDEDGDMDLFSGDFNGDVRYFKNDGGVFTEDIVNNPFQGLNNYSSAAAKLVDMNQDNLPDLFLSNWSSQINFYQNTGAPGAPVFTLLPPAENPLDTATYHINDTPFLHFADIDHDGDLDVLLNGASPYDRLTRSQLLIENTGTAASPVFDTIHEGLFPGGRQNMRLFLTDYDGDGDLDAFGGNENGSVSYFENENEIVRTTVASAAVQYNQGDAPVLVDPTLTLEDPDEDYVIKATVSIRDYATGESLAFTPAAGISGTFDSSTGVLTFVGKASAAQYQDLLRTVTFEANYDMVSGRRPASKKSIVKKTIDFSVWDADHTNPQAASATVDVFVNDPPAMGSASLNVKAGGSVTHDLKQLASDPNGAADIDISSFKVVQAPGSGAVATINASGMLSVNYDALAFIGTETMTVEVCDMAGECAVGTVTLVVTNTPPVITPQPVSTAPGEVKGINLMSITTDVDGNLNPDAFAVVSQPLSGAIASIQVESASVVTLSINYDGLTFKGQDQLTIRACDHAGACTDNVLTVEVDVTSEVIVYNAVAPNSSGDNRYMRITGLPAENRVSIFNRWGDKVFDAESYQNTENGNAFRGENNQGTSLASGTYFYMIEIPGQSAITGYLILKQ